MDTIDDHWTSSTANLSVNRGTSYSEDGGLGKRTRCDSKKEHFHKMSRFSEEKDAERVLKVQLPEVADILLSFSDGNSFKSSSSPQTSNDSTSVKFLSGADSVTDDSEHELIAFITATIYRLQEDLNEMKSELVEKQTAYKSLCGIFADSAVLLGKVNELSQISMAIDRMQEKVQIMKSELFERGIAYEGSSNINVAHVLIGLNAGVSESSSKVQLENQDTVALSSRKRKVSDDSSQVKARAKSSKCEHNRQKSQCKDCRGGSICPHNRRRTHCKDCGGGSICEHSRIRSNCKDCGGSAICIHSRQRTHCKECGGGSFCIHKRRRAHCRECGGSAICQHDRLKARCRDCGGSDVCPHNRQKTFCRICGGGSLCQHDRQRSKCKECGGNSLCEHQRVRSQCKDCRTASALLSESQEYVSTVSITTDIK